MPYKRVFRVVILATLLASFALAAQPAHATAITINETTDDDPTVDNGSCSLREAIIAANTNAAVDACPAGSDITTDVIWLANGSTYSLTIDGVNEDAAYTGDLDIIDNSAATDLQIVVAGGGAATISQDATPDDDRVLESRGATVEITGVTITGGDTGNSTDNNGGGIYAGGGSQLVINDSQFTNNRADGGGNGGAIYARDTSRFVINDSQFTNNRAESGGGGAIWMWQWDPAGIPSTITNSHFDGNASRWLAGAIGHIAGTRPLEIRDSTFTNNHADLNPVDNSDYGGGALATYGDNIVTRVVNSTFSGNSTNNSGGAILRPSGNGGIYLYNVTITGNTADSDADDVGYGGGIARAVGTFELSNSIVAGNAANRPSAPPTASDDCYGTFSSGGYNLIGIYDCSGFGGTDQLGPAAGPPLNPLLVALANNGCAVTLPDGSCVGTRALQSTSPAVDMGNPGGCSDHVGALSFDQRGSGFPRALDGGSGAARCDVGAYEYAIPYDYGDAPTAAQSGFASSYPTLLADSGAGHAIGGPYLGTGASNVDWEADGQPTANADGDDTTGNDDENGITFTTPLTIGSTTANVRADVGGTALCPTVGTAYLHGWIDFNADGDWGDPGEQIINNSPVGDGINNRTFTVPAAAVPGSTYARFRIRCANGALGITGPANDGEVEDHTATLLAPGIRVTESGGGTDVAEAGTTTDTFTLAADTPPSATVSVPISTDGQCTITSPFSGTSGTVTLPSGVTTAVTVTVQAVDDAIVEANPHPCVITTGDPTSTDSAYDALDAASVADVTANVADDDTAGLTISTSSVSVTEGQAPATYPFFTVVLDSQPTAGVTVTLTLTGLADPPYGAEVSCDGGSTWSGVSSSCTVDFEGTSGNAWNVPLSVYVRAYDDNVREDPPATGPPFHFDTVTVTASSGDGNYNPPSYSGGGGVSNNEVAITITDNETEGIGVTQSGGSTDIAEWGTTIDTFTIAATTEPIGPIAVPISTDGQCLIVDDGTGPIAPTTSATATIPAGAAATTGVTITVQAVDDVVMEGPHTCAISFGTTTSNPSGAVTDMFYHNLDLSALNFNANVTDNDTDLTVTKTDGMSEICGYSTLTWTVVVTNAGLSDADGATVTDPIGTHVGSYSWTCSESGGAVCPNASGSGAISEIVATFPAGGSVTYLITASITAGENETMSNSATVAEPVSVTDIDPTNNSATDYTINRWTCLGGGGGGGGKGPAALDPALSKRGEPSSAAPGETVIWTITVWNPHSEPISGVIVSDPIPGMFDIIDVETPVGTATVSGQIVTITVPSLAPGQSFDVTITTVANELATPGEVCNTAYSGAVSAVDCISMYPGMLPETGADPVSAVGLAAGAAALAGSGVGATILLRRRRTQTP